MPAAVIPARPGPLERNNSKDDKDLADGMSQLNPPKVDATGKPTQRAITSAKQAWSIGKAIRDRAVSGRIKKAAIIASKYNGDAPFSPAELRATGQGWRNNFSTNFLASLIDRVTPQLTDPANKADLLTHSQLPNIYPDGATKSRKFQETTSKTIRAWKKWKDLLSGLAKEIVLYGNACPVRIDKNWRPRLFGFGESFLPEGTGQHSTDVQIAVFHQPLLLHEFLKLFKNPEVARKAGYNVESCVKIANRLTGAGENGPKDPTELDKQDAIREGGTMGWSYENPNRTVNLLHVVCVDYTGEVDLWTVDADQGEEVRHELGLHEGVEDGITLFTFQSGNKKYYGSKGLGRLEANLHTAIERGRNLGADQMYLSGLIIFEGDPKDAASIQSKVRHPFVVVKAGKLLTQQIVFNAEAFEMMDQKLVTIAETIAGAFIPPNLDNAGSSNTKIEAAQKAERELAVKEGVLGRFFDHLSELVGMMQRGIYAPDNIREGVRVWKAKKDKMEKSAIRLIWRKVWNVLKKAGANLEKTEPTPNIVAADQEAVEAIVELLDAGLTPEEIVVLSLQPAGANNSDEGAEKDNRTLAVLTENKQAPSPFINQRAAEEMRLRILAGEDRAKQLLIPDEDPTIAAIAKRTQIIEISEMVDGNEMPVAGTDNHPIHREVLGPRLGDLIHALEMAPTVPLVKSADLMINHYAEHIALDTVTPDDAKKKEVAVMRKWQGVVDAAAKALEKRAAEIAAAGGKMGPDGNPVPVEGKPVMAEGPGGTIPGENGITPEHQMKAAEILAAQENRKRELDLEERRLGLEEAKHDHAVTKDALTLQQGNVATIQEQQRHEEETRQAEADRELQATLELERANARATGPAGE